MSKSYLREIELRFKRSVEYPEELLKFKSSEEASKVLRTMIGETIDVYESFIVLYLDGQNQVIGWQKLSTGGVNQTIVDVRLLFATALKSLALSILICHNHPSGNLIPSEQDKNLTKQINEAAKFLQIRLLDHIIITEKSHYSFSDDGLL